MPESGPVRQSSVVAGRQYAGDVSWMTVENPATGAAIAEVPAGDRVAADAATRAAREALPDWAERSPRDRSAILRAFAAGVEASGDELAEIESANTGKSVPMARREVAVVLDNLHFFAGAARVLDGQAAGEYATGFTSWLRREPVGVVAAIVPWNYPLVIAGWKVFPAIAGGNTVVVKPASLTPLSAIRLAQIAAEHLPPGVVNVVTGAGSSLGTALAEHPGVDMVALTGDAATGRMVAEVAGRDLKRLHLELGGKAPVLIFEDVDVDAVADELLRAAMWNAGQDCTAPSRLLVADEIAPKFTTRLSERAVALRVGDPNREEDVTVGPIASGEQLARIAATVSGSSGTIAAGGHAKDRPGYYFEATVITEVEPESEIVQQEIFGPVVTVETFRDEAHALQLAASVPAGLASSVWTRDIGRALRVSRQLHAGIVWINAHGVGVSEMPHGGRGPSGYGHDKSKYALEEFTNLKHVMAALA